MIAHCSEFSVECDTVASLSIEKSKENLNIFDFELGSDGLCCGEACNLDVDISTVTDWGQEMDLLNNIPESDRMLYFGHTPDQFQ